jgi:hypothetical protein
VIEDLDGPEPAPNRRGHVLVISLLLLIGVVAGYAAVSSPELRGPYATPRPSPAVLHAVFTPAPASSIEPAAFSRPAAACSAPLSVWVATTVVNGQAVSTTVVNASGNPCLIRWGNPPMPADPAPRPAP